MKKFLNTLLSFIWISCLLTSQTSHASKCQEIFDTHNDKGKSLATKLEALSRTATTFSSEFQDNKVDDREFDRKCSRLKQLYSSIETELTDSTQIKKQWITNGCNECKAIGKSNTFSSTQGSTKIFTDQACRAFCKSKSVPIGNEKKCFFGTEELINAF